ncbi:MAG TPA: glucosaminidase domain-containing protein [Bacteroidia bacterium]|nr:glucosaminidase domain-containing protein [Bacteroidia bacterium]
MRTIATILPLMLAGATVLPGQPSERKATPQEYVNKYKEDAIREMQMYKVPASITLAQGMLESDNGNSALAVYANNHFGIKCHKEWSGETYIQDDDKADECFRKYTQVYDSYVDHSQFLRTRARYSFLFDLPVSDYKGWSRGLKEAGYATDPRYAERLIELIERYKLHEYDRESSMPPVMASSIPRTSRQETVSVTVNRREVYSNNDLKYVVVKQGDSFMKIAEELEISVGQLYRYNELPVGATLTPGQMLYIQPKRKKASDTNAHTVKPGENMYAISQQYGIKVRSLYKLNLMPVGSQPPPGTVLKLKK